MSAPIRVLVVDDHALLRGTLAQRLEQEADLTIVGSVGDAGAAVDAAAERPPDVVLMDVDMPGLQCFEAVRELRQVCAGARVLFLSAFFHDRYIEQALAVQAWGYVTKNEPVEAVVRAIRKVAGGVAYYSPEVQARIVVDATGARLREGGGSRASMLTEREVVVLRYLARGLAKKEIASVMHLSVNTVNRHTTSIMGKLDIHDRVELARYAIREGLAEV